MVITIVYFIAWLHIDSISTALGEPAADLLTCQSHRNQIRDLTTKSGIKRKMLETMTVPRSDMLTWKHAGSHNTKL